MYKEIFIRYRESKKKTLITAKLHSQSRSIDCSNYGCVNNLFSPPYGCVFHSHKQQICYYELTSNYDDTRLAFTLTNRIGEYYGCKVSFIAVTQGW